MHDLRKIDALVAEHVMGWTREGRSWKNAKGGPDEPRRYTSSIAAAWDVVEKICGSIGHWQNGFEDGRVIEDIYEVKLPDPRNTPTAHAYITEYDGSWSTAFQRAIVEYLKAKGVAVDL